MFRDYEVRYLVLSVVIALGASGWVIWYETAVEDADSLPATITAIGHGISAAVAIAILTLASWEVIMVIARRWQERQEEKHKKEIQEARQEVENEWAAWLERMREAQREGREFDEPAPSEKAEDKSS